MKVEQIMKSPVVTTQQSVEISNLKDLFQQNDISAVPVIEDDGNICGIISSSDLVAIHNNSLLVRDVMTRKISVCARNVRVKDAAKMMVKNGVHHLVVMDDGEIVGILSSLDIVKVFAEE